MVNRKCRMLFKSLCISMPVSVRLNHAIADGFLVANVYRLLEKEMAAFCMGCRGNQNLCGDSEKVQKID